MLRTALLCLAVSSPLLAQTAIDSPAPAPRPSGITVRVPLVLRDKKGAPVGSVGKDDLTLTEDSAPQTILTIGPDTAPLTFGILVDTSTGQHSFTAEEKAASLQLVDALMQSAGAGAAKGFVVHFDREVELLADLSASREKVEHGTALLDSPEPPAASAEASTDPHRQTLLYDALFLASDEITSKQTGRKVLVLFSSGIDRGSKETLRTVIDTAQRTGTTIYAVYAKGEQQKRDNTTDQRNGTGRQRGGMGWPGGGWPGGGGGYPGGGGGYPGGYPGGGSGYPGGSTPRPQQPAKVDGKRILADIVTPTGGRVFELSKKENAAAICKQIEDDLAHQSVLTFMPDKTGARPGFHSLRVESKRKDTVVEARDGFYIEEPN